MSDEIVGELHRLHVAEDAASKMIARALLNRAAVKSSDLTVPLSGRTYRFVQTRDFGWILDGNTILFRVMREQSDPTLSQSLRDVVGSEAALLWPWDADRRQIGMQLLADAKLLSSYIQHTVAASAVPGAPQQTLREIVRGYESYGKAARVGVIIDVSGSMHPLQAEQVKRALLDSYASSAALVDTEVVLAGSPRLIASALPTPMGRGTDFRTSVEDAWEKMGRPEALVLVTDGECASWPKYRFPVPTTVALTKSQFATHPGYPHGVPLFVHRATVHLKLPELQARGPELAA